MDSKEAPEDEEGLKAQGHFLPLSSDTPSSLVDRVRTSTALLYCALTSKGRRRTPIARARIATHLARGRTAVSTNRLDDDNSPARDINKSRAIETL